VINISRMFELRDNVTACDAAYVALAEALDARLLTRDARLASASRRVVRVELA
jgi:predicted nucleic acid-binding protein